MNFRIFTQAVRSGFANRTPASRPSFRVLGRQALRGWAKSAVVFGSLQAFLAEPESVVADLAGGSLETLGVGYIAGTLLTRSHVAGLGAAFFLDPYLGGQVRRGMQAFSRLEQVNSLNRNELTGTMLQAAYTMRQAAARELSGSLMNARQWLGREAAFYHG